MKNLRVILSVAASVALAAGMLMAQSQSKEAKELNAMPYAKVKAMLSNPQSAAKLKAMVNKYGVTLMGGQAIRGKPVTMQGELTGADCYLSQGVEGPTHSLCAKACVAHGSPILFLAKSGTVYLVLTPKDGVPYPTAALNALGTPNVTITGFELESSGIKAISVQTVKL